MIGTRLWDALNEARKALRRYAEHGTAVREQPAEYRVTGPIRTYDSLPYERREEVHPPHVRFTEGTPDRSYPVWFATDRQIIPAGRADFCATGEWSETLTYCACVVHVPKNTRSVPPVPPGSGVFTSGTSLDGPMID